MSERTYAPRSGGRTAQPRSAATPGRTERRDPAQRRGTAGDARAARRRVESMTGGRRPVAVDGTAALDIKVTASEPMRDTSPAVAPQLRVAPPAPISAPRAPFVAGVIALVIVGVLGILLINTKTNENSFQIANLQKAGAELDSQQQDLENQLVEVSSIGSLDAAARRLGLVKAEHPALIRLQDGKVIGPLIPTDLRPAITAQDAKTAADATTGAASTTGAATTGTGR